MKFFNSAWLFTQNEGLVEKSLDLNTNNVYFITGGLTQTGIGTAHLYISTICRRRDDQILCAAFGDRGDAGLRLQKVLGPGVSKVIFSLKSTGAGDHFGEVAIYDVTEDGAVATRD
jgi:hypothetical protein